MRAQEEPEGQTQVLGDEWELGGGRMGWGLEELHTGLLPGRAETKVLINLIKSDCPRLSLAIGGRGGGGRGVKETSA